VAGGGAGYKNGSFASEVTLALPGDIALDVADNLYIADGYSRIYKVTSHGRTISTVVGVNIMGFGGDGVRAVQATLNSPCAVAVDATGTLYIADTHNHRIRAVRGIAATQ